MGGWVGDSLPLPIPFDSRLMEAFPVPYSLYEKSLELEQRGLASSNSGGSGAMTRLRRLYERTIRDYGSTHVGECL